MIDRQDLTLVRFPDTERCALQRSDGQELAVWSMGLPSDAFIAGRTVRLTVGRRHRRVAIEAANEHGEIGSIEMSWVPGRYQIRVGDSRLRVARRVLGDGWHLYRDGVRIGSLELSPSFDLHIRGSSKMDAGRASVVLDADVPLALVLLLEMIDFARLPVPG